MKEAWLFFQGVFPHQYREHQVATKNRCLGDSSFCIYTITLKNCLCKQLVNILLFLTLVPSSLILSVMLVQGNTPGRNTYAQPVPYG